MRNIEITWRFQLDKNYNLIGISRMIQPDDDFPDEIPDIPDRPWEPDEPDDED